MSEQIIFKKCYKCKKFKPLSEFHKSSREKDGCQTQCKVCISQYHKQWIRTEKCKKSSKEADIKYRNSIHGHAAKKAYKRKGPIKIKHRQKSREYRKQFPERIKACRAIRDAIRIGKMPCPKTRTCHYCSNKAIEYHHWHGYAKEHWLDVIPMCQECHTAAHI